MPFCVYERKIKMKVDFKQVRDILSFSYKIIRFDIISQFTFIDCLTKGKMIDTIRFTLRMGRIERKIASFILNIQYWPEKLTHEEVVKHILIERPIIYYLENIDLHELWGEHWSRILDKENEFVLESVLVFLDAYNLDEIKRGSNGKRNKESTKKLETNV